MQKCRVCDSTEYDKVDGYFFCKTCQTQNEDIREEVLELRVDSTIRLRKQRIRSSKSEKSSEILGWTSWELYNFILIGLTDELISLGVTQDIKLTILQLWATYLRKIEVAFISTKKKCLPRLTRRYNKRDAEIIYGKMKSQKRKRKRAVSSASNSMVSEYLSEGSSMRDVNKNKKRLIAADYDRYMQSQASSEGDGRSSFSQGLYSIKSSSAKPSDDEGKLYFNNEAVLETRRVKKLSKKVPKHERVKYRQKHTTTIYKMGPQIMTPMKLWAIIYIALRIHDESIHLGDMLRYGREGHLSYYKLEHLLPPEVSLTQSDMVLLTQNVELTHKGMRRLVASMAKFLGVYEIVCPNLMSLVSRYCQELELPRGVSLYVERFITLSPPIMAFNVKAPYVPNYEGRAMAFIIVVLKMLFSLDGVTEYEISKIAEKINSVGNEKGILDAKLYNFREWQEYIECRRTVLAHLHFPTKLKYHQEANGVSSLYIKFLEGIHAKNSDREEPEITNYKHRLPRDLSNAMKQCIADINYNNMPLKEVDIFAPSLTPLYSYIRQLTQDPLHTLPQVLETEFFLTKIGYITKVEHLQELATQCDIQLEVVESGLHFVEKIVPQFEQIRIASVNELKNDVEVHDNIGATAEAVKTEDFNEYVQRGMPCKIKLNLSKELFYSNSRKCVAEDHKIEDDNDFEFNATTSTGKLLIPNESDSESENDANYIDISMSKKRASLQKSLYRKYGLELSSYERSSIDMTDVIDTENVNTFCKRRTKLHRDSQGRFIKKKNARKSVDNSSLSCSNISNLMEEDPLAFLQNEMNAANIKSERLDHGTNSEGICKDENDLFNLSNISLFDDIGSYNHSLETSIKGLMNQSGTYEKFHEKVYRFFRPFTDYWVYHCVFSRVKPKNFELFEKSLPINFRWLLNECAHAAEMTVYDLYEEVCLIESYHAYVFKQGDSKIVNKNVVNPDTIINRSNILSKW